ncbi:MAG: carboxypeptidase-like regulatory domain-containing protein, partial [Bryobacteraceae bacterium]
MIGFRALCIAMLLCGQAVLTGQSPAAAGIDVTVLDQTSQAVPGARVQLQVGQQVVASAGTDEKGHARFTQLTPARYAIVVTKEGFEPV